MDRFHLRGTRVAGKFEVQTEVAEASNTVTYFAEHVQTGAPYALKVFKVLGEFTVDERERLLQNLIQSAVDVRRAADENHVICAVEEMGPLTLKDGKWVPYVAYPWIDGKPLSAVVQEERDAEFPARTLEEVMELLEPVALALTSAHQLGVVHAGINPETVIIVGDARSALSDVRLVDFGVAQAVTLARMAPSPITGRTGQPAAQLTITPTYFDSRFAAPEQVDFTGHPTSPATDVYSLALLMAFLLRHPDDAGLAGIDPTPYRTTPGRRGVVLAAEVEDAFVRATSRDPSVRPGDVMSFWNTLRASRRMPALHFATLSSRPPEQREAMTAPYSDPPERYPEAPSSYRDAPVSPVDETVRTLAVEETTPSKAKAWPWVAAAAVVLAAGGGYVVTQDGAAGAETLSSSASSAEAVEVESEPPPPPKCDADMATVPASQFFMGSDEVDALDFEKPAHQVKLRAYCIDKREVTLAQYKACSDSGKCIRASKVNVWSEIDDAQRRVFDPLCNATDPEGRGDHPVNCVTYDMAQHYCEQQGRRLPTEAEWELAARGTDGRIYPWGDDPPAAVHLNGCGTECQTWARRNRQKLSAMYPEDDGFPHTAPVGSFPKGASQYGLEDVVGNVWEWVGDWYQPYTDAVSDNPKGPKTGEKRVIRGGAWNGGFAAWVRPTFRYRDFPDTKSHGIGFRCAKTLDVEATD